MGSCHVTRAERKRRTRPRTEGWGNKQNLFDLFSTVPTVKSRRRPAPSPSSTPSLPGPVVRGGVDRRLVRCRGFNRSCFHVWRQKVKIPEAPVPHGKPAVRRRSVSSAAVRPATEPTADTEPLTGPVPCWSPGGGFAQRFRCRPSAGSGPLEPIVGTRTCRGSVTSRWVWCLRPETGISHRHPVTSQHQPTHRGLNFIYNRHFRVSTDSPQIWSIIIS